MRMLCGCRCNAPGTNICPINNDASRKNRPSIFLNNSSGTRDVLDCRFYCDVEFYWSVISLRSCNYFNTKVQRSVTHRIDPTSHLYYSHLEQQHQLAAPATLFSTTMYFGIPCFSRIASSCSVEFRNAGASRARSPSAPPPRRLFWVRSVTGLGGGGCRLLGDSLGAAAATGRRRSWSCRLPFVLDFFLCWVVTAGATAFTKARWVLEIPGLAAA